MDSADSPTKTQEDENYNLLCQAHEHFRNAKYERCLELLHQLQSKGESSGPILRHNCAVVKYYQSGCMQHALLLKELEQLDPDAKHVESSTTGLTLKLNGSAASVARYNKSVIYYHRHMYATALEKLEPLVNRLEALEKHMGALVATLQLQLLLATNQLNRAEAFLDYLQYKLNFLSAAPSSVNTEDAAATTAAAAAGSPTTSTTTQESASARIKGKLGSTLKLLQLLTHVLNRKPVLVTEDGTPQLAALKAHQYYIMKDFQMAAKQLMRINNECGQSPQETPHLSTCLANNMGVIHLRVRHYAIAAKFFQNALNFDRHLASSLRETQLQTISSARSCEILYNLGIAMLHLRRPKEAFQCFLMPIKLYDSNPRLWFRMAEACIMENEAKSQEEERESLSAAAAPLKPYAPQSGGVPEPTLEFAVLCLRSALTLTLHYKANFHIELNPEDTMEERPNWRQAQDNNFCNPSKPISLESLESLLAAIYASHSFVSLRLGDYITALEMAEALLKTESLSDAHKLLGHMYAGEALMHMDKTIDAREHLDPTFVSSLNAFDFETRDWQVKSLDAAQNIVRYNLAVAMTMQNDFKTAKSLLSTLTHSIVTTKAISLRRFIEAKLGATSASTQLTPANS